MNTPHESRRNIIRALGMVEAGIQEGVARQEKIREASEHFRGRIQSRLTELDDQGGGDPDQRGRLLAARHWCRVAGA